MPLAFRYHLPWSFYNFWIVEICAKLDTVLFIFTTHFLCLRGIFLSTSEVNLTLPKEFLEKHNLFLNNLIKNLKL